MWDVVAASGVLFPEILAPATKEKLRVIVSGKNEGAIVRDETGNEIYIYKQFKNDDPNLFYMKVADILTD